LQHRNPFLYSLSNFSLKQESTHQKTVEIDNFRKLLVEITLDLKKEDWYLMCYMFKIPESIKENFKIALDFFDYTLNQLFYGDTQLFSNQLQKMLKNIHRNDLAELLRNGNFSLDWD